jgi:hypothetical protein
MTFTNTFVMSDKKVAAAAAPRKTTDKATVKSNESFVFGRENFIMMLVGVVVIVIGFFLMSGREEIFSSTKLTVAPIVIVIGFIIEIFAIMRKAKD